MADPDLRLPNQSHLYRGLRVHAFYDQSPQKDKAVIALGEISGHKHVVKSVKGEVEFYTDNGLTLVSVEQEAELVHEEHEKILLSKGLYMFGVQREVTIYGLVRQVMD